MIIADQFAALADPTRRGIFELIRDRPTSVGELSKQLPISQPAVSQHLRVLREANLARCHSQGRRNIYSVDPTGIGQLKQWIDGTWDTVLDAFVDAAEREASEEPITIEDVT